MQNALSSGLQTVQFQPFLRFYMTQLIANNVADKMSFNPS